MTFSLRGRVSAGGLVPPTQLCKLSSGELLLPSSDLVDTSGRLKIFKSRPPWFTRASYYANPTPAVAVAAAAAAMTLPVAAVCRLIKLQLLLT